MIDFTKLWAGIDWAVIVLYFAAVIVIGLVMRSELGI